MSDKRTCIFVIGVVCLLTTLEAQGRIFRFFRRPSFFFTQPAQFTSRGGQPVRRVDRVEDLQRINGFSNLAILNNQIVELDAFGRFKQKLFIDPRSGQLFGRFRLDANTNAQLREFYLREFEKFQDAAQRGRRNGRKNLDLVSQFLKANGGFVGRDLPVALNFGVSLADNANYKNLNPNDLNEAILLDLLNTVSDPQATQLVTAANLSKSGNLARVEGLGNFFRADRLGLLTANNPYACTGVFRADWLATNGTLPGTYYSMLNIPGRIDGRGGLFEQLGVDERTETANRNFTSRIVVDADDESIVASAPYRVLERQRRNFGLPFRQSFDFSKNQTSGAAANSNDVLADPFRATDNHIAREMLWLKKNGFMAGTLAANNLANGQVNRADSAPADVTRTEVTDFISCMNCHSSGFLGGKTSLLKSGQPYTDLHNRLPGFAQGAFTSNAIYAAEVDGDNALFLNAKRQAGAFVPKASNPNEAAPALFDLVSKYRQPLSVAELKKEFEAVTGPLSDDGFQAALAAGGLATGDKIQRTDVEKSFCSVYNILRGGRGFTDDISTSGAGVRSRDTGGHATEP